MAPVLTECEINYRFRTLFLHWVKNSSKEDIYFIPVPLQVNSCRKLKRMHRKLKRQLCNPKKLYIADTSSEPTERDIEPESAAQYDVGNDFKEGEKCVFKKDSYKVTEKQWSRRELPGPLRSWISLVLKSQNPDYRNYYFVLKALLLHAFVPQGSKNLVTKPTFNSKIKAIHNLCRLVEIRLGQCIFHISYKVIELVSLGAFSSPEHRFKLEKQKLALRKRKYYIVIMKKLIRRLLQFEYFNKL